MTFALKLMHDEPRLVYLALVYHLGRPGSELDPETMQPSAHGLRAIKVALGAHVQDDDAIIELNDEQFGKLLSAIYGSVNELRVMHIGPGARSTVAGFTETAKALFPDTMNDPEAALEVSEAMMMLHRRLERAVSRAAGETHDAPRESSPARHRWPFGKR